MALFLCKNRECKQTTEAETPPSQCPHCKKYQTLEVAEKVLADERTRSQPQPAWSPPSSEYDDSAITGRPAEDQQRASMSIGALSKSTTKRRLMTSLGELDRVLGGGLTIGSVNLFSGDPGIGKSTLLLQALHGLAEGHEQVCLYVTGEESKEDIAARGLRMGVDTSDIQVMESRRWDEIEREIIELSPIAVVVDSVQTMSVDDLDAPAGSIAQVRAVLERLARITHERQEFSVLLVSHVTKDGDVAGPKTLEHMVDGVFMFMGELGNAVRTLMVRKNRNGPNTEFGVLQMGEQGFHDVENPSEHFLAQRPRGAPGSIITTMCGEDASRSMCVEVQALVTDLHDQKRQVVALGPDRSRLNMLLAALEKRGGCSIGARDVFVNIVGGISISETSIDLALLMAIVSAKYDKPIPEDLLVMGEVGLTGEIRDVKQIVLRLEEAQRMGFRRVIMPEHRGILDEDYEDHLELTRVGTLTEAIHAILGEFDMNADEGERSVQ